MSQSIYRFNPSININKKKGPNPLGPYAQFVKAGNIIFISGQIPINPDTKKIPDGIYEQTYQVLKNIQYILETNDLEMSNLVKTTLFITDINTLTEVNRSYIDFFNSCFFGDSVLLSSGKGKNMNLPARSCVEVSRLPKDVMIEIEAIASCFMDNLFN